MIRKDALAPKEIRPYVFILITTDFYVDAVSEENLQILRGGLGWDFQLGTYLPDLIPEGDRAYFIEHLGRGVMGQCYSFEMAFDTTQLGFKSCEVMMTPSQVVEGKVTKIGLAFRCKDEFREDLAKLTSEGLLGIVFNSVSMGICITDRHGNFVDVNQEYCRIYGYDREELIGKNFTIVLESKHHEFMKNLHNDFFITGKELPGEFEVKSKDGSLLSVSIFADKLTLPNGAEFKVTSITNITALKSLKYQLESISKNLPGIVLRLRLKPDGTNQFLYVSDAVQDFFGFSSEEVLENEDLVWSRISADTLPDLKNAILASSQLMDTWEVEWKYLHPDGTMYWHRVKGKPEAYPDGSVILDSIVFDVTHEKAAEIALDNSQRRFEKLIEEGVEMISVLDREGKYSFNSPSYQTILGYSMEELNGLDAFSLIHPEDVPQLASEFQQVFSLKKVHAKPYRIRRKDGAYVWMKSTGTNLLDDPLIRGIIVNSYDITELIQVESDLKSSEQQYKYLFENNPGAMMIWELETGKILDINDRACAMYGYDREEFLEVNVYKMRPEEEVSKILEQSKDQHWLEAAGTKLYHGISKHFKKSGELLFVEVNAQMIHYHGQRVSLVLLSDVTQKLKAREELLISEQKYRSVFNLSALPKVIYRIDKLEIVEANKAAIQTFGFNREEFLKLSPTDLMLGDGVSDFLNFHQKEIPMGTVIKFGAYRCKNKNGELIHMEVSGQRFIYQEMDCMMIVAVDISEKVSAETLNTLELELMEQAILAESSLDQQLIIFLKGLEQVFPQILTSVLQVKSNFLYDLASPSISKTLKAQLEGLQLSGNDWPGSVFSVQSGRALTKNLSEDLKWQAFEKTDEDKRIKASLFLSIYNSEREVIALFGVYFLEEKDPSPTEIDRYQRIASLISLILENHRKREELKLSNERYELVNLATKDAIYDWDITNQKLYWGKSYARFRGSVEVDENNSLANWENLIHPSDLERVREILANDLENKERNQFKATYQFQKADGNYCYVEDKALIVRDEIGKAIRLVGVLTDVTNQRLEEFRLKLLESVITNANDAVVITEAEPFSNPGPKIVYVNEAFTKMTGYSAEEVLGKSPKILHGPQTNPKELLKLREAMMRWQSCEVTTINYKKNGEEFWTNFSVSPVANPEGWYTHWISIQRDVTVQKIEEQKKELLAEVVKIFGEESRFNFALDRSLERLVQFKDHEAGEVWLVNSDKTKLNLVSRFARTESGTAFFSLVDKKISFLKDEGLPGLVWSKNEILIYNHKTNFEEFKRKKAAEAAGITDIFGIPLHHNQEVIGVLIFLTKVETKAIHSFAEVVGSISQVLGSEIYRKKVEDELSQIFDTAQDIICIMGFDGKFRKVNKGAMYLLGYSEEEFLSKNYLDFVHPDDLKETENVLSHLSLGQNFMHSFNRLITSEGEVVWLDWNSTVVEEEELIYSVAKDITEEKELQNSLDRANKMARIGFWDVDVAGGKGSQYWSSVTKEIFEVGSDYTPNVETGIKLYPDEASDLISMHFNRCMTEGIPYDLELPAITAKGNQIWVRAQGQAEFRDGVCHRVFGSIQDISDLKKAHLDLESAFEQKNAILESIGDAFFSLDKDGRFTYWNAEASHVFGGTKEERLGQFIWDLHPFSTETFTLENLRQAYTKGSSSRFEQYYKEFEKWLEVSIYPSEIGLSVYLKDITIRKTTEELIRQSNERFERVAQVTEDAIWDWDFVSKKMYWGEGFRTLFGIDLDHVVPSVEYWFSLIHPEDVEYVGEDVKNSIYNPEIATVANEYRFRKADGSYSNVEVRGRILRNENGQPLRIIGAVSDITKRKEFESSLRSLNEKLELRAKELAKSNAELEQFAYVASHDLQEPLRMVSSFLTQLEKKYETQLDERAKMYINFAVDGAKRMRQIILDLLEFSRVGRIEEEPTSIPLSELIEEVCRMQSSAIKIKNAKITYSNLPLIKGFRTPLIQVFQNLISNAIKYSKQDQAPEVKIACSESPGFWEFTVEDNGIGMDAESFDRIFVIFQRLHTKDEFDGTGIGLAIVKKIVENLGGRIWVTSELDRGTTFHFTIKK